MVITEAEIANLWGRVLEKLKSRVEDHNIFINFFEPTYVHDINNNVMTIVVPGALAKGLIEKKYLDLLSQTVQEVTESLYVIQLIQDNEIEDYKKNEKKKEEIMFKDSYLNPSLTFDNYVIGPSNRDAAQAGLMIASNPSVMFNPLFVYSESGLGKTHLLHAIGNYIKNTKPGSKIICITSDDFFNEYVKGLTAGKDTTALRDYCRTIDVFLIDDIQFLKDKSKTQELFYYVFNDLVKNQKQIVITSDRQPNELKDIEDRLISRFGSGLSVKINEPDRDTCVAILKKKIAANNMKELEFDEATLNLLATKFSKNVRELEGALNKLVYHAILHQTNHIDLKLAVEAVSTMVGGKHIQDEITEQKIIDLVADYYNLTPSIITGNSHNRQITLARHMAMYLIRTVLDTPFKKIGEVFSGKDHSTVMNGINKVEKMLKTDEAMQTAVSDLKKRIKN